MVSRSPVSTTRCAACPTAPGRSATPYPRRWAGRSPPNSWMMKSSRSCKMRAIAPLSYVAKFSSTSGMIPGDAKQRPWLPPLASGDPAPNPETESTDTLSKRAEFLLRQADRLAC